MPTSYCFWKWHLRTPCMLTSKANQNDLFTVTEACKGSMSVHLLSQEQNYLLSLRHSAQTILLVWKRHLRAPACDIYELLHVTFTSSSMWHLRAPASSLNVLLFLLNVTFTSSCMWTSKQSCSCECDIYEFLHVTFATSCMWHVRVPACFNFKCTRSANDESFRESCLTWRRKVWVPNIQTNKMLNMKMRKSKPQKNSEKKLSPHNSTQAIMFV